MLVKKHSILLLLLTLCMAPSFAQNKPTAKQQEQSYKNGYALYKKGKFAEAVPLLEQGVGKRFASADLPYWLGVSYCNSGKYDKALPLLLRAVKRTSMAHYYLAISNAYARNYTEAFAAADHSLNNLTLSEAQKTEMERVKAHAQMCLLMIQNVDDIEVIDSLVVPKKEFFKHYLLGPESGFIHSHNAFFAADSTSIQSVYENQKQTRILYAKPDSTGAFALKSAYRMGDGFEEGTPLKGTINSTYNDIQPFLMADGVTIYFASDRPGGVGGYDLYISRYNLNNESYLAPENIGMPYNSEFNDYLMAIDEVNNVGWFASDRYQKDKNVVIYTFEYHPERRKIADRERALKVSTLQSIGHTQRPDVDYSLRQSQIAAFRTLLKTGEKNRASFVINDSITYSSSEQFLSPQGALSWEKLNKKIALAAALSQQLEQLRETYSNAKAKGAPFHEAAQSIWRKERELNDLTEEIRMEGKQLRIEENSALNN